MTSRDRNASRRAALNERPLRARLQDLVDWHERRARATRLNAEALRNAAPIASATLCGDADTHDVAAAVLRRVLDGKAVE